MLLPFTDGKLSILPSGILDAIKQITGVFFCSCFFCLQHLQILRQNKFRIFSIDGTMPFKHTFPKVLNITNQIPKAGRYKYPTYGVFDSRHLSSYEQYSLHGLLPLSAPNTCIHEHIFNL